MRLLRTASYLFIQTSKHSIRGSLLILEVKVASLNHATSSTEKLELTRGLGKVVSVLAFSSGDPSLNPVEV